MQPLRDNAQEHVPPPVIREHLIVGSAADREWIRTDYLSF